MFEEEQAPDILDSLSEVFILKEKSVTLTDEKLIDFVIEYTVNLDTDQETKDAIASFFNKGKLSFDQRKVLENCYINLNTKICLDLKTGEMLYTFMR
jgi:hypothetical protein